MNIKKITRKYILEPAAVDGVSEEIRKFLSDMKLASADIMRHALTVEELLLNEMDAGKSGTEVTLDMGRRFFSPYITVTVAGEPHNVYNEKTENQGRLGTDILKSIGVFPGYSYTGELNKYSFTIKKNGMNPIMKLLFSLIFAFAVGSLGLLLPQGIRASAVDNFFTPVHSSFLNLLRGVAGPMVFLSVAWGIYGMGDAATLKQIGKRILFGYVGSTYALLTPAAAVILLVIRPEVSTSGGVGGGFSAVFTMLLDIIPKDMFTPFTEGNTLQIIFMALVIGIAMLILGQKTDAVAKAVEQINLIVRLLIEFISSLVPFFIITVVVKMSWNDNMAILFRLSGLFVMFLVGAAVCVVLLVAYASLKNRVSPLTLSKKAFPSLLVGLTTASSAAVFGINMDTCTEKYGIEPSVVSFGIPLGMVVYKPLTAVCFFSVSLFFAQMYSVEISVVWVLTALFISGILAIATPPIPGGALSAYTVLFTQLNIPVEALAIVLACDTLIDPISTGFNMFFLPISLLNHTSPLGLVNRETLLRINKSLKTR